MGKTGVVVAADPRVSNSRYYTQFNEEGEPKGWLWAYRYPGWHAWEEIQVFVHTEHRGQGLAKNLYLAAVNHDRLLLMSGRSHTKYTVALWKSFIKKRTFSIWAQNIRDSSQCAQVSVKDDVLVCPLEIYHRTSDYTPHNQDIRLMAMSKK